MTASPATSPPAPPKEDPETLVLRGAPRRVVRFRRGLIVGLAGAVAASLVAVSWLALEPPSFRTGPVGAEGPPHSGDPDALADVPANYGDVPRLGPPLPGDLGRPILERRKALGLDPVPAPESGEPAHRPSPLEAEQQRRLAEGQAARSSPVLFDIARPGSVPSVSAAEGQERGSEGGGDRERRAAFAPASDATAELHRLQPSASPFMLQAGTVIPASLVTGLNSDLPGLVIAQVTENVRDSATGRSVLVPQGARLLGRYDSAIAFGQRRALVVWTRLLFPDGASIALDNVPASDSSGFAGLEGDVDDHGGQLLQGIGMATVLGVGTQLGLGGSEGELVRALRQSAQRNGASAGERIVERNLDVQPTLKVMPGWPVRAILAKDLILSPWRGV